MTMYMGEDLEAAVMGLGADDLIVKGDFIQLVPTVEPEWCDAQESSDHWKIQAELKRQSMLVKLLQEVTVITDEGHTIEEMFLLTLDCICSYTGCPVGHIYNASAFPSGEFSRRHLWHLDDEKHYAVFKDITQNNPVCSETGLIEQVNNRRQSVWIADVAAAEYLFPHANAASASGLQSGFAFPVLVENVVTAVFECFTPVASELDQLLLDVLAHIGTHLGHVVERKRGADTLIRYNNRLQIVYGLSEIILIMQTAWEVAAMILDFVSFYLTANKASVALFDFETNRGSIFASIALGAAQQPHDKIFSLDLLPIEFIEILRRGEIWVSEDFPESPEMMETINALEINALPYSTIIPIFTQQGLIGTLNVGSDNRAIFEDEQIDILQVACDQLVVAIEQARLREQIRQYTDELEQNVRQRTVELQSSKDRIETMLNSAPHPIILTTAGGHIQQANPAFNEQFYYGSDEVFNQPLSMLVTPDSEPDLKAAFAVVTKSKMPYDLALSGCRRNGAVFEADVSLVPIVEGNVVSSIICMLRDVTDRNRMTRLLQMSEERYRTIVQNLPDGVIDIVDSEFRFVYSGGEGLRRLGLNNEILVGKSIYDITDTETAQQVEAEYGRVLNGESVCFESQFNGQTLQVSAAPLRDADGNINQILALSINITERKQLEDELRAALARQKELNDMKTNFVSMVSHDFRTPMSVIQSSTDLLHRYYERMTEDQRTKHFEKIGTHIQRMTDLLNDMLTLGRADADAIPFKPALLDFNHLCSQIVEEFRNGQTLKYDLIYTSSGEQIKLLLDETLIYQAITNLLTNAFKYSPEGSTVRLELLLGEQAVELRCIDQGIGIPEADQVHLFESFHRASNVGNTEGTGLGLAIVKRSVEAHGGAITFESAVGIGTTFTITIPIRK